MVDCRRLPRVADLTLEVKALPWPVYISASSLHSFQLHSFLDFTSPSLLDFSARITAPPQSLLAFISSAAYALSILRLIYFRLAVTVTVHPYTV